MITYLKNNLYHTKIKSVTFWNGGTFTQTLSVQDLHVILKWHTFQVYCMNQKGEWKSSTTAYLNLHVISINLDQTAPQEMQ